MLLIFIALSAFADTIVLKGGKQIEGTVLERNMDEVKIDFKGVELIYSLNEIESINGEKVISLPAEPTTQIAPADVPAQVSPEEVAPAAPQEEKKLEPQAPEKKGWAPLLPLPGEVPAWLKGGPAKYGKDAKAFAAIAIGLAMVILIFVFIFYIYYAICLMFIAKKTNTAPAWLAWIPIGNLFLMCKNRQGELLVDTGLFACCSSCDWAIFGLRHKCLYFLQDRRGAQEARMVGYLGECAAYRNYYFSYYYRVSCFFRVACALMG